MHDCSKVRVEDVKASDYGEGGGPSYTKKFTLRGKEGKKEKLRMNEKPGLFGKNFKVKFLFRKP